MIRLKQSTVVFCAVGLFAAFTPASAQCTAEPISIYSARIESEGSLTVTAGKGCLFNLNGIPGAIAEARIVQQPKFGRAGVKGLDPFYVAKPGYRGQDEFAYAFIGTDQYGGPMHIVIKRKVTVVP